MLVWVGGRSSGRLDGDQTVSSCNYFHSGLSRAKHRSPVWVLLVFCLLAVGLLGLASCGDKDLTPAVTSVTDVTVPPPDSPAAAIYEALGWNSVYVVYWLKIDSGWAYVHAIPFTTEHGPTIDTRAMLRQNAGGGWDVVQTYKNDGLLTDVGQAAEDEAIPAQLKRDHPDAPPTIFPPVRADDRAILDAVRNALGRSEYRFNVFMLNESNGWAFVEVRALRYQAGTTVETREKAALLRFTNGSWTVMRMVDLTVAQTTGFSASLQKRYPEAPADILP